MGRNSRLDNLQAAWLNRKLQNYPNVIKRRRQIAEIYENNLAKIQQLTLPPAPSQGDHFDVFQNYELVAEERDSLRHFLKKNGIGTLIQWGGKAVHQWPVLGFKTNLPKVEEFFEKCLMLPMNMFITDEDVLYICEKINEFYENR